MRLVETVAAEVDDQLEDLLAPSSSVRPRSWAPLMNSVAALVDDLLLLLADRLDAGIGAGQLDAAQTVEDAHDLFLIDHDAVGLGQDFFHDRVRIGRLFAAVLAVDVGVDHAAAAAGRADTGP